MGTLTLFGIAYARQDGASGTGAETLSEASSEPLLTGADEALWVGFGAFILVFLVVMIAIIRARVIKPAERAARDTRFFEPAGADAEITFDEPAQTGVEITKDAKKDRKKKPAKRKGLDQSAPTDVAPEDDATKTVDANETGEQELNADQSNDDRAKGDKNKTPASGVFAGIFNRPANEPAAESEKPHTDELTLTPEDAIEPHTLEAEPADVRIDHLPEVDRDYWNAERDRQEADNHARAEEERRMALEEAERARAAAAEAEAARARRDEDYREAEAERRTAEAALNQSIEAVAGMQEKLDAMAGRLSADAADAQTRIGASLDEKFQSLSDELQQRLATSAADASLQETQNAFAGGTADAAFDKIAAYFERLEQSTEDALARLSDRIDALSLAAPPNPDRPEELHRLNQLLAERAAPAVAGVLQLGDIVRSALPADRYELGRDLKTGVKADCLILRPGARGFVIDARYPADAYDRYARADDKSREHAATAYRRAILRHMIFVAEKLIIPDETEDFAILFVPNDAIFNDLHRHFADIVQDSYRARIWLVSPTSLMATLHMMNAASRLGAETRTPAEQALESAVGDLAARIDAIEEKLANAAESASDATTNVDDAPGVEPTDADALDADFEEAQVEILSAEDDASDDPQTPFPLR